MSKSSVICRLSVGLFDTLPLQGKEWFRVSPVAGDITTLDEARRTATTLAREEGRPTCVYYPLLCSIETRSEGDEIEIISVHNKDGTVRETGTPPDTLAT